MSLTKNNWFYEFFIKEAKPAINAHVGSGFVDPNDPTIILVDEAGNQLVATLVDEEIVFDATANDIREGKLAVTEQGVTVGTKEIPGYVTTEGYAISMPGSEAYIKLSKNRCEFTKLIALVCTFNETLSNSVATEKVVINGSVYLSNSTELLTTSTVDVENGRINLGIINEGDVPYVIRYITLKEE